MAILANFIGIDKYADLNISDLLGARRDATALWALFCDSITDIEPKLITDEKATVDGIRLAFDETLSAATSEDDVIFFFAGHGTQNHRFVAYDTEVASLDNTTISMAELAERFKTTKAKAVLCILDCCFSGGAPARVLENTPISRDLGVGNAFDTLVGKGRILIAASNIHEPAYEHPSSRHGFLTKALLDVLQTSEELVNLTTAMDVVLRLVEAEASRMGVKQTPVLLGYIEGGLTLPSLQAGKNFFDAFPEKKGVRISHKIQELAKYFIPKAVLNEWGSHFQEGLNDLQLQAINEHRILDGQSLLVVAPTSSGKTFIGELGATRAIIEGRKAVFLLPYRALVNEKYEQFAQLYGESLGMRVIRCTGDYSDQTKQFVRGKYDLALLTYEMFLYLTTNNSAILNQIGLVVLDEAQFITDPQRGIIVELLLTYLLSVKEKGITPQIIVLSAVIGDINNFDTWLGVNKLVTDKRPVPLVEGVLDRSGTFQFLDTNGEVKIDSLLSPEDIKIRKQKESSQDVIVPLVKKLVQQGEKVIIFRNQKGVAQGCANYLAKELDLPQASDVIKLLPNYDLSTTSTALRNCLNSGTAFHTTNLTREEREIIEKSFREPKNQVQVLAATTTIAAGINTPASTVILAEQEFIGDNGRHFTVAEYKNMAGRAGRLGLNQEGKAIILANHSHEREKLFQYYVLGELEPFSSSFDVKNFDTWLIRLLSQVYQVPRTDVFKLLTNTYGGYLASREYPKWQHEMQHQIETILEKMIKLNLIEQEMEYIQLTLLGRACGESSLSFKSVMRLVELLQKVEISSLTAENLMALIQVLPELDDTYTPVMKKRQGEVARQNDAVQRYGNQIVNILGNLVENIHNFNARCKRASIIWDWIKGVPIEEIEQQYSPNLYQGKIGYSEVRRFADATRFYLRSAHQIISVKLMGKGPDEESTDVIFKQLELGVPNDILDLLKIPLSLNRGEYLALRNAGIKTDVQLWSLPQNSLQDILGKSRSEQLNLLRPK